MIISKCNIDLFQVDLYKEQLDETLEQSRRLRRHSDPPPVHSSCPQLQIIYPVNRPLTPSQRQWRMDQRRQVSIM